MAYKEENQGSKRGFNRLDPDHMGVPSYTVGTRTFALTPDHDYFEFWAGGVRFKKATAQTIVWPDTTGMYYFYFDTNGDLQYVLNASLTEAIFLVSAICGLVYYNKTAGVADGAKDEQHGVEGNGGMDSSTHFNLHLTHGFHWAQGGLITGLADASSVYTNIGVGLHFDEDIINVSALIEATPFYYKLGADGEWTKTANDLNIAHIASGDTYASWNEYTGGAWQLTECTNSTDYVIMMMVKFNFATDPYRKLIGTQTYASRNAARDGLANELKAISLAGLSSSEAEFQFAWIAKRAGDLEDDGSGNAYVDLRGVPINAFS